MLNTSLIKIGICILFPLFFLGLFGPLVSPHSYDAIHPLFKNLPPSADFWFGTDELGRDLFTRVCYGARISLSIGILAGIIDLAVGVTWGGISGFFGGFLDECMMRILDALSILPSLLIVIGLTLVFGNSFFSLLLAITFTGWITMARMVRGEVLRLKQMEYALAAKALGASSPRILFGHLLPNASGPILSTLMLTIPSAIFSEAFLSFLGLGIQAPLASWGTLANDGLAALQYYPWRLFFPSCAICLTLLGFHFIGEGLHSSVYSSAKES